MQNRDPNQQPNVGSSFFNRLLNFFYGTNASSSSSTAAAAASTSAAASAAAMAAAVNVTSIPPTSTAKQSLVHDLLSSDLLVRELVPWLDHRSRARLDRINRCQHNLFSGFAEVLLLPKLAHYLVVEPNPDKVIAMIRANPQLLQSKIKEVRVNGISIRGYTPFQLAYGACDVNAKENEGGLCEALEEELARHLGSKEAASAEIQRQIEEKKLNVVDKAKDTEIKNTLATALRDVIQAISHEQFNLGRDADNKWILNPATLTAIGTFRVALAELQPKVVEEGMHFRSITIQETWDAYAQAAATTWGYNHCKCALFADGALSSVLLSCLPVNDKQRLFGQGYYYLYEDGKEPFARRMTLRGANINFDDCLRGPSLDFAGLSGSYVDIIFPLDGRGHAGGVGGRWTGRGALAFKTYVEQKLQTYKTYAATGTSARSDRVRNLLK